MAYSSTLAAPAPDLANFLLPQTLADLEALLATEMKSAIRQVVQQTRQPRPVVELFVRKLHERIAQDDLNRWQKLIGEFPDIVAPLMGDPSPTLIRLLDRQLSPVLRYLRRGQKLKALEILRQHLGLESGAAQRLGVLLANRSHCITKLLEFYDNPPAGLDLFQGWPPQPAQSLSVDSLFVMPSKFSIEEFVLRLGAGDIRACVAMVRRFARVTPEYAQGVVDGIEDWILANEQPSDSGLIATAFAKKYPAVWAKLNDRIDPASFAKLHPIRSQVEEMLVKGQRLAASRLIESSLGVDVSESRRLCKLLQPQPIEPEISAPPLQIPDLPTTAKAPDPSLGLPSDAPASPQTVSQPTVSVMPSRAKEEITTHLNAVNVDHQHRSQITTHVAADDFFHSDTHDIVEMDSVALTLDEATHRIEEVIETLDRQGLASAKKVYAQLEEAGFNRQWVIKQMPLLGAILPSEPWREKLPELADHFRNTGLSAGASSPFGGSSLLSSTVSLQGPAPAPTAQDQSEPIQEIFAKFDEILEEKAQGTVLEDLAQQVSGDQLKDLGAQLARAIASKDLGQVRVLAEQVASLPGGAELLESSLPKPLQGKELIPTDLSAQGLVSKVDSVLETHYKHSVVGEMAENLSAEQILGLVGQIKNAIKSGDAESLRPALETVLGATEGEKHLRKHLPVVEQWFGETPITVEAVMAQLAHPRQALLAVLKRKNPKLLDEIDLEKFDKLVDNLPNLKDWFRRGQLHKASVFLFKELRLGPSDISDLIKVIREIL